MKPKQRTQFAHQIMMAITEPLYRLSKVFPNFKISANKNGLQFSEGQSEWTRFELVASVFHEFNEERCTKRKCDMIFENSRYIVLVYKPYDDIVWLSFRGQNNSAHDRDWRDYQRIKNELCGTDCEGIEIFPQESRLVDTANQFHLWVFEPSKSLGIGYPSRDVLTPEELREDWQKNYPHLSEPEQREFEDHHSVEGCHDVGIVWSIYRGMNDPSKSQKNDPV